MIGDVMRDGLLDHPAVQAWRRALPEANIPAGVELLKDGRLTATFRLHHGQDAAPPIIAKRRPRIFAETEHAIYQRVLPHVPIPRVRCIGFADDEEPDRAWLFIEDVGGEPYRSRERDHQVLAARWLGEAHAFGMSGSSPVLLPERGCEHYLQQLRLSSKAIASHLDRNHLGADDRRILLAISRGLAELEQRWDVLERWCNAMPRTLVHGDFVAKNCRVRRTATHGLALFVFDWEMAGWGPPAVDLATNALGKRGLALDYATYGRVIRGTWGSVGQKELTQAIRIGDALRVLAAIAWGCESLDYGWAPKDEMRFYVPHLEGALRLVRGNSSGPRRHGSSAAHAVQKVAW